MRRPQWSFALTLLLLAPGVTAAASVSPGEPTAGALGPRVKPTSFTFASLPRRVKTWTGPLLTRREGVFPEADSILEELKRHPQPPALTEMGTVTLDRGRERFTALASTVETGFEGITQGGFIPGEPTVAAGPLNIFSAGNVSVTVTDKDGSNRVETEGPTFFGVPSYEGEISDAQCTYDALRGRVTRGDYKLLPFIDDFGAALSRSGERLSDRPWSCNSRFQIPSGPTRNSTDGGVVVRRAVNHGLVTSNCRGRLSHPPPHDWRTP
jgi:hypothetical protein